MSSEELFAAYTDWAVNVAKQRCRKKKLSMHLWDAQVNAALCGLWRAAQSYETDCGASFKTFARFRILGSMMDEHRRDDIVWHRSGDLKKGKFVPTGFHIGSVTEDEGGFLACYCHGDTPYGLHATKEEEQEWLLSLVPSGRLRDVFRLYYFDGFLMAEIAEKFKLTEARVFQIHSEALSEARRKLRIPAPVGPKRISIHGRRKTKVNDRREADAG